MMMSRHNNVMCRVKCCSIFNRYANFLGLNEPPFDISYSNFNTSYDSITLGIKDNLVLNAKIGQHLAHSTFTNENNQCLDLLDDSFPAFSNFLSKISNNILDGLLLDFTDFSLTSAFFSLTEFFESFLEAASFLCDLWALEIFSRTDSGSKGLGSINFIFLELGLL